MCEDQLLTYFFPPQHLWQKQQCRNSFWWNCKVSNVFLRLPSFHLTLHQPLTSWNFRLPPCSSEPQASHSILCSQRLPSFKVPGTKNCSFFPFLTNLMLIFLCLWPRLGAAVDLLCIPGLLLITLPSILSHFSAFQHPLPNTVTLQSLFFYWTIVNILYYTSFRYAT